MGSFTELLNQLKQRRANAFASSPSLHQSPTSQAMPSYGPPPFPAPKAAPGPPQTSLLDILRPSADSPFQSPRNGQAGPEIAGLRWGQAAAVGAVPAQPSCQAVADGHAVTPQRDAYRLSAVLLVALASPQVALASPQEKTFEQRELQLPVQPHGLGPQFRPHDCHVLPQQQKQEGRADVAAGETRTADTAGVRGEGAALSRCSSVGSCSSRPCAEQGPEREDEQEGEEFESWETDSCSSWEFDDADSEEEEEGDGDERRGGEEREEREEGIDGLGRQDVNDAAEGDVNVSEREDPRGKGRRDEEGGLDGSPHCTDGNNGRVDPDRSFEDAAIVEESRLEGQEGCVTDGKNALTVTSLQWKRSAERGGEEGRMHVHTNHTHHVMVTDALEEQRWQEWADQGGDKRRRV